MARLRGGSASRRLGFEAAGISMARRLEADISVGWRLEAADISGGSDSDARRSG